MSITLNANLESGPEPKDGCDRRGRSNSDCSNQLGGSRLEAVERR